MQLGANQILIWKGLFRRPSLHRAYLPVCVNGSVAELGYPNTTTTQRANAPRPCKGHEGRVGRPQPRASSRISISTARSEVAGQPRHGLRVPKEDDLCSRLFLAWSRLQAWSDAQIAARLLAQQNHIESPKRCAGSQRAKKNGMARALRLGMSAWGSRKIGTDSREVPGCVA